MTTEATEPIFSLEWVQERRTFQGDIPEESIDPLPSIRLAHDYVLRAIRDLDRLQPSEAMDDVRDAIQRLNDAIPSLGDRGQKKAAKGRATLQDVRKLLREDNLEKAENYLHETRDWLREALDTLEGRDSGDVSTTVVDRDDAPDPTVELSDALTRPKEELTLLELAVMEAPNRGEEFADMLKWRLHDTRQKLEEAQERATERLQARRGKLNGGDSGE